MSNNILFLIEIYTIKQISDKILKCLKFLLDYDNKKFVARQQLICL
jgi:DNA-binding winged helix-turn-helix (wHTH) protein